MRHRDLTIRVYGRFPDKRYVVLAHQIGAHLMAVGLGGQAVLVPDATITASDLATAATDASVAGQQQRCAEPSGQVPTADGAEVGQASGVGERPADG